MGKVLVALSDEIEGKLRNYTAERYTDKRGAISIVVEDALREFLKMHEAKR